MASSYQTLSQQAGSRVATLDAEKRTIRSVSLTVAGQRISLRTDQDEAYLNALASEVNALVDSLRLASPGTGLPVLMALASIQLADRALSAEMAVEQQELKVERHIERLNGILKNLEAADGNQD